MPDAQPFSLSYKCYGRKYATNAMWWDNYAGDYKRLQAVRKLLSKGINKQQSRTGSLFQQKTKAKLTNTKENSSITALHYIHQNPFAAGLVSNPKDWACSSSPDYT